MFSFFLVLAFPALLVVIGRVAVDRSVRTHVVTGLLVAFFLRISLMWVVRNVPFFSHGVAGGDCNQYEFWAWRVARRWDITGVQFVTAEDVPEADVLASAPLPVNAFAFIMYLDGEDNRLGCVALVAFVAAVTGLLVYRLAIDIGADPRRALLPTALFLFGPNFVFHTSGTYKDGIVVFLTIAALYACIRLAAKMTLARAGIAAIALFGLWYVRFYLVFMAMAPVAVSLIGVRSKSALRPIFATVLVGVLFAGGLSVARKAEHRMEATYQIATSQESREWNRVTGGSGVEFDDGGNPFGALGPKVLYTVFSPFPWMPGSVGLQIGKLDAFLWYWFLYRAFLASRTLWREDRRLLFMFLVFLVPSTIAYATTMANVGLIVRQRLPLVALTVALAARSWKWKPAQKRLRNAVSPRLVPVGPPLADAEESTRVAGDA